MIKLFFTALLQVSLVAMNVIFISNGKIIPMCITAFGISFFWTLNVKSVAFGGWGERITYATGAMVGTLIGSYLAKFITLYLNQ